MRSSTAMSFLFLSAMHFRHGPSALDYMGTSKWLCNVAETGHFGVSESTAMNFRSTVVFSVWALLFSGTEANIIAGEDGSIELGSDDEPKKDVKYYQIWASQDGETHFTKCTMHGFNLSVYASLPQYLRSDFGGEPLKTVFTELPVGFVQPLHSPPEVQFVVTLLGSWYVQTVLLN
jgi:hypothetical protein